MNEENSNPPKIKLKIRKTNDYNDTSLEQEEQKHVETVSSETGAVTKKIKISRADNEETEILEENSKNSSKKRTIFQIMAIILTVLLIIAVIVEIGVMIWLKSSTDRLKNQNDKLPLQETSISAEL